MPENPNFATTDKSIPLDMMTSIWVNANTINKALSCQIASESFEADKRR